MTLSHVLALVSDKKTGNGKRPISSLQGRLATIRERAWEVWCAKAPFRLFIALTLSKYQTCEAPRRTQQSKPSLQPRPAAAPSHHHPRQAMDAAAGMAAKTRASPPAAGASPTGADPAVAHNGPAVSRWDMLKVDRSFNLPVVDAAVGVPAEIWAGGVAAVASSTGAYKAAGHNAHTINM